MKKIFIFFATVASVIFASCSKEYVAQDTPSTEKITRITASVPDTKTYLDGLQVKWQKGETIKMISGPGVKPSDYTLEGEGGSTVGTFVGTTEMTAPFWAFSGCFCVNSSDYFFYDIPTTQKYSENSISSGLIPMFAQATGYEVNFKHLGNVLRFDVSVADAVGSISVKSVKFLPASEIPARYGLALSQGKPFTYSSASIFALSNLPATLTSGETTTFYFVVGGNTLPPFTLEIKDTDFNTYSFVKPSSMALTAGKLYKYTGVTISEPDIKPFVIKKDNGGWEPYYEEMVLSGVTESIIIKDNPSAEHVDISNAVIIQLKNALKSNPNVISLDLSGTTWATSLYSDYAFKSFGDALGDLYLPSNITRLKYDGGGKYGLFNGNKNLKLHIHEGLDIIDEAIIFCNNGVKMNSGTGIFVAENNTKYMSVDGVLYNKAGTMICSLPSCYSSYAIIDSCTQISEYGISNDSHLASLTVPAGITNLNMLYSLPALKEIIYKRPAATKADVKLSQLPAQTYSTSPKYFRVPQSSLAAYTEALDGKLNGWTLEGYTE